MSKPLERNTHFYPFLLISTPLMLLVPFTVFVHYQGYDLWTSEIMVCVLGLSAAGVVLGALMGLGGRLATAAIFAILFVVFVDLQFDWIAWWGKRVYLVALVGFVIGWVFFQKLGQIVAAVTGTMIIATFFLPQGSEEFESTQRSAIGEPKAGLPVVVHLILDEHIGVEGIQLGVETGPKLKARLQSFYEQYGFRLFGKAVSQYFNTSQSIGHVLNFASSYEETLVEEDPSGRFQFKLTANKYFRHLDETGYNIHVYQTSYMDICPEDLPSLMFCRTQRIDDISELSKSDLLTLDKVQVIAGLYLSRSIVLKKLHQIYWNKHESRTAGGLDLGRWDLGPSVVSSLSALSVLDRLRQDLLKAQGGDVYIVHIMLPHYPYVYDRDCHVIPLRDWLDRFSAEVDAGVRALRNERYHNQIECFYKRLNTVLEGMKDLRQHKGPIVIVHGDHGSRITDVPHPGAVADPIPPEDYVSSYSTLLAIRHPDVPAGYDLTLLSIQELLAKFLQSNFEDLSVEQGGSKDPPLVYRRFTSDGETGYRQLPMVDFFEGKPRS